MRRRLLWAPLLLFSILFALVAVQLASPGNRTFRSKLVGQALPLTTLPAMLPSHPGFGAAPAAPRLVNIFASWCAPCAAEVEQLQVLKGRGIAVDGIAVRDTPTALRAFLARYGDPYRAIGDDPQSRSMMALGSSGVPESFVVDARGVIRYHHVGPIGAQDLGDIIREAEAAR